MKTEEKESEGTGECSAGDEGQERREEKREQTDPSRSPFPRPPRLPVSVLVGTVYTQTEAQAKRRLQTYSCGQASSHSHGLPREKRFLGTTLRPRNQTAKTTIPFSIL